MVRHEGFFWERQDIEDAVHRKGALLTASGLGGTMLHCFATISAGGFHA
jgi:hypothetical protein